MNNFQIHTQSESSNAILLIVICNGGGIYNIHMNFKSTQYFPD